MDIKVTNEEFDEALANLLDEQPASHLLSVPGVYEILREHFNNDVLAKLDAPIVVPPLTWLQASAFLKAGDRIRMIDDYGNFPLRRIRSGMTGTVEENSLNEMQPILFVKLDEIVEDLKAWDNVLQIVGPDQDPETGAWDKPVPFERI